MYERILVPTDGSDVSAIAEHAAIVFARAHGSEIVALAVGQPQPPSASAEAAMAIDPGLDAAALLAGANGHAARVAAAAQAAGVRCTPLAVIDYSPGNAIVDAAGRHGCDLIFMGSHGRRGLSRVFAGSVPQQVLADTPVPVMVFRPQVRARVPAQVPVQVADPVADQVPPPRTRPGRRLRRRPGTGHGCTGGNVTAPVSAMAAAHV